ncbi:hypothetical protein H4W00_002001 [Psychrobacter sp. PL19]|uniref:hypothetical protein n=1 Tax=Psychrobacter sp. PL19 TaxID=2760711 RepID=UPI001AEA6A67
MIEILAQYIELIAKIIEFIGVLIMVLGFIVLIQTFLSLSLQVALEGRFPQQKKPLHQRKVSRDSQQSFLTQ